MWARARIGHLATTEVITTERMQLRNVFYSRVKEHGMPGPLLSDSVFITGSWDAFSRMEAMEHITDGEYAITISLGATLCERFRIVLNENPDQTIYPEVDGAGQHAHVQGPDWKTSGRAWFLDGRADKASEG